jgi:Family of unknown function (DUF5691)
MSYFESLATRALLGTSRDQGALSEPPAPLSELRHKTPSAPETALLEAAAAFCLYERAGRMPATKESLAGEAPPDNRPQCSQRAAGLLQRLLAEGATPVLIEWLTLCTRAEQRPPAALLPALCDLTLRPSPDRSALRLAVKSAIGPLGFWLCRQNPDWLPLVADEVTGDASELWQTGGKAERLAALGQVRLSDPVAGREMLEAVFATETAADRASFLEVLGTGLTPADAAFLEAALSDRSKEVRATAANLLAQIPGSAFVKRMTAHVAPLITFTPAEPAKLLRKSKPAKLTIELPAECTEAMKHDGIEPKPTPGSAYGPRQFCLHQLLAMVPPAYWSQQFGATPIQLLDSLPDDLADLVLEAWHRATLNSRDIDWAEAILRKTILAKTPAADPRLLKLLPDARRNDLIHDVTSENDDLPVALLQQFISAGQVDVRIARRFITLIFKHAGRRNQLSGGELSHLLIDLAYAIPPHLLPEFEVAWPAKDFEVAQKAHETFFTTLTLRNNIHKEFVK